MKQKQYYYPVCHVLVAFYSTYDLKRDILTHFGPKKGDLVVIELSGKVGTTCNLYQYITKIIIILFIPSFLCFSGVSVDFPSDILTHFGPKKGGLRV